MKSYSTRIATLVLVLSTIGAFAWHQFNTSKSALTKEVAYDHPDEAALFEFERTKDPALGFPPRERLEEGLQYTRSLLSKKRKIDNVKWRERGPDNFGGRTRAVMFDPNDPSSKRVFAAGVTGGLWVKEDITKKDIPWEKINDFLPSLAVNNIVYDPTNTQVFYFGTGEGWFGGGMVRGNGIYKSEDAGMSWVRLESTAGAQFHYTQKIVVTETGALLASTRSDSGSGGVYRSGDGGVTWNRVIDQNRGADIEVVGGIIYASTGIFSEGRLFKSTNDGNTWTNITPDNTGQRIEIGVHPNHSGTLYVVASNGNNVQWFKRSDNAGATWTDLTIPEYLNGQTCSGSGQDFTRGQAWYDLILGVHPDNPQLVVVGGIDLHRSDDGGATWEPISYWTPGCESFVHADQHNFIYRPGYPNQALSTNDGGVYYVADITVPKSEGGPIFENRNKGYNVTQFYSCATLNEVGASYFIGGTQDNGSHQLTDKGISSSNEVTGGDGAFTFIDQNDGQLQITSYVFASYYVTNNSWGNYIAIGDGNSGLFINPADYNSNTKTLFACGGNNEILRYAALDEPNPQQEKLSISLGGGQARAITVSPYNDEHIFVGASGVYLIDNANGAMESQDIGGQLPNSGSINNIAIGESEDHLLAIYSNYGVESVWETTDGGSTWSSKEGNLPDIPVRWALFNPNDTKQVLLATELGIWSTSDITATNPVWEPSNEGLANVRCDMLRYREADGLVVVATHGRGIFTTDVFANQSIADFYIPNLLAYEGQNVNFRDASTKADSYNWDFGDGATSIEQNPVHSYDAPGKYQVILTINGDMAFSRSELVVVLPALGLDYELVGGGDFESNQNHFFAVTRQGSGWQFGRSDVDGKDGTNSGDNVWVTGIAEAQYQPWSESYLYTPLFDFSLSGTYQLEFYTKYNTEAEWDGFIMEYTLNAGESWTKLGNYLDPQNWYNLQAYENAFSGDEPFFSGDTGGDFVKKSIDISGLGNNDRVGFRFVFKSDGLEEASGVAVDDFQLYGPKDFNPVLAFDSDFNKVCVGERVIFTNRSSGAINSYSWDFGESAIPQTATGFGPHEVFYSAVGTKIISLTGNSSEGEIVLQQEIEIGETPMALLPYTVDGTLCRGDAGVISLDNSQLGASYQLYDITDIVNPVALGAPVEGTGATITFPTNPLSNETRSYRVTVSITGGCDLNLSPSVIFSAVIAPIVEIEVSGLQLASTYRGADTYQWYLNSMPIENATEDNYKAVEAGAYAVEVTNDGCTVLSEEVTLSVLGLNGTQVRVYPNPVENELFLDFESARQANVEIINLSGQTVLSRTIRNSGKAQLDLSGLASGIYHVELTSGKKRVSQKIIKK